MTDVLERTEWIKEPDNDQSRAQTEPKVPVVSETIPNEDVKVYTEEEFADISQENKARMNLPFRSLKDLFEKLCKEGREMNPLRKSEELVLENVVNHLSTCTRFKGGKYGDVVSMVEEVNMHYHTKTCRKKFTK
jgi:hypothetical protein